ncbi:polyprenyl synthetase family protein [Sinobaca sp. H24]|uniref:polyprenyl synthetase family protein n=1 Tax=Sinobaca sp. H24 TaxID=2923376 RepID=UPI00207AE1F3|nr:farnesyl diphosphate synthase [Sinobaca sp. H24]
MNKQLESFISANKARIDEVLPQTVQNLSMPAALKESMLYSIEAGGKRVRPLLLLAAFQSYQDSRDNVVQAACAVELIHTYSLIHDDLPAMDDDDYRRGKLTNHKVYGEAHAILAGDAMLTRAFELLAELPDTSDHSKVMLILELSRAAGAEGMVGGQVADMEGEKSTLNLQELESIHHRKTGDLLGFSIIAGGILAGAPEEDLSKLRAFGRELGLVFQIKDDILDVEGDSIEMGKPAGSDENKDKSTYPKLLSLEGAKEKLSWHAEKAKEYAGQLNGKSEILTEFVEYIQHRTK